MITRYGADRTRFRTMTSDELRESFLLGPLFAPGMVHLEYCEVERAVVGAAVPAASPLKLEAGRELAAQYFCERREVGVLNIGGPGKIAADGESFALANLDCLYIGRGTRDVVFTSDDPSSPARFYLLSYPSHSAHPTTRASRADAEPVHLGSAVEANVRTIYKYIHPDGIKSSQLVMGFTVLEPGSVWNTMPAHTHERRTEVYMYFNLPANGMVFHLMGPPGETRHLAVREGQAVISPMWSIHSGVGTGAYAFCWGMGGENQTFTDMDPVSMEKMK
jgi:4-deoxy-L-threo-5-hexosulose-uronate ketol-isomerase